MVPASIKMKALVASRLLMGEITAWTAFEDERKMAGRIVNRRTARSVSSQIGRGYDELSRKVQDFIDMNFVNCEKGDLAQLCDAVEVGRGISLRLDEFEKKILSVSAARQGSSPVLRTRTHFTLWFAI